MAVNRLRLGQLLFGIGLLVHIGFLVLNQVNPEADPARLAPALWAARLAVVAGTILLLTSRKQAEAWFTNEEFKEDAKRVRRAGREAQRMAAGGWGDWDEFTQIRRPQPEALEFRSTSRICMLAGVGLALAAFVTVWWTAVIAALLFFAGKGASIDGTRRRVRSWKGWIYWPVWSTEFGASELDSVTITKALGMKPGEPDVGRTVRHPLWLVHRDGRRIRLKPCPYAEEARALAEEIHGLLGIPVVDQSGEAGSERPAPRPDGPLP